MRILMVCLGNICRSPLAEGIMQRKIQDNNLDWVVDSAGTIGYHIDAQPDERSVYIAKKYGIDISAQRGRKFNYGDFELYDLILVMDSMNYQDILIQAISEEEKSKVQLIMNFASPGRNIAVPDPYYGGDDGFEKVYQMLVQACDGVIEKNGYTTKIKN